MTYQGDPNRPTKRPTSMNRDGEGWGYLPIALGIAAIFLVGFLLLGPRDDATGPGMNPQRDVPQTRDVPTTRPVTPPATAPTTPPK
jgi:hypothetical protein